MNLETLKNRPGLERFLFLLSLESEVRAVLGDEADLVDGHVFLWEDRADGAGGDACAAVNALVWMNVELIVAFVNAFDWANFDAGAVFGSDARLGNNVCHVDLLWVC